MLILATSDTHGNLPEIPPCDLLIIAGDVCPMDDHNVLYQAQWLKGPFRDWLQQVPAKHIVGVAGNHDFIFECPEAEDIDLPWHYLKDSRTDIEGVKIYGTPWVPNLPNWAFHGTDQTLDLYYSAVPRGMNIVVSHGPPFGYGDFIPGQAGHVGPKFALEMIDRIQPQAYICGHIHEGFGHYRRGRTQIYNVAYVDEFYTPRKEIIEIDLSADVKSDAEQEPSNPVSPLHGASANSRRASESVARHDTCMLAMADKQAA